MDFVKCCLINSRSIVNKLHELHDLLSTEIYQIILITETWLTDKIPDCLVISGQDYSLFRKDRPSGAVGGGVCALVNKKNCQCTMVQVPDDFSQC